jgi:hypothetical protein
MKPEEAREYVLTLGRNVNEPFIKELIQTFVNLRILCDKDQNGRYELRHDALAAKIYEKFTMAEKEFLEVRKFIENSYDIYAKRGTLLNKQDIDYLASYENKLILPEKLTGFIDVSKKKYEAQRKALRRITTISTIILIILLAFVLRFYIQKENETTLTDQFSAALLEATVDPAKGLISELAVWEQDTSSVQLHEIILRDFRRLAEIPPDTSKSLLLLQQHLKPVVLESNISKAFISKQGRYIYGCLENNNVFVHELSSARTSYLRNDVNVKHIEFSEENSMLALIYENYMGVVYDFNGTEQFEFVATPNGINDNNLVRFMHSDNGLVAAVNENTVTIFDKTGSLAYELKGHSEPVNSVDISTDGKFIVTASSDKKCFLWNYNPRLQNFSIYDSLIGHNGRIWSCRFNKTGKYIITASEDSTIKIWDLYGNQINPEFRFIIMSTRVRLNNREGDEDRTNPYYSKYYGKFCDAVFSPSELEIIATGYNCNDDPGGNNKYYKVMFFDGSAGFPHAYNRVYFLTDTSFVRRKSAVYKELLISPDVKIAAVTINPNEISLLTGLGIMLMTVPGHSPMFSSGGKVFYWADGNTINKLPVHPAEIKLILEKFRISSVVVKNKKDLLEI